MRGPRQREHDELRQRLEDEEWETLDPALARLDQENERIEAACQETEEEKARLLLLLAQRRAGDERLEGLVRSLQQGSAALLAEFSRKQAAAEPTMTVG